MRNTSNDNELHMQPKKAPKSNQEKKELLCPCRWEGKTTHLLRYILIPIYIEGRLSIHSIPYAEERVR